MSAAEIEARLAALRRGEDPDLLEPVTPPAESQRVEDQPRRLFRPWVEAAEEYITWSQTPHQRIYTGIGEFDDAMRGIAPRELLLVAGYSQGGKTLFTTQALLHNHDKRVALFTPDETRVLVLVKMASILHGVSAEEIEQRLAAGDPDAEQMLRAVAVEHFPHFAVFDEITDLALMDRALDECEAEWGGQRTQLVVIDYAGLVTGQGEDIPSICNAIKAFGKRREVPLVLLHQASRSSGADGKKMGIDSGAYGGEQQATFMVGVRRKRAQYEAIITDAEQRLAQSSQEATIQRLQDVIADARYEAERHRNTVTFSLVKNKRPPARLVDDTDFVIDEDTGRVVRFDNAAPRYATYGATVEHYAEQQEAF